jgi:hypothetical protein
LRYVQYCLTINLTINNKKADNIRMTTFTTFATATFATGNIVVVESAENMIPGLPISFTGNTFGNVTANATFYIGNITFGFPTSNITLTSLPGGAVYALANGSGNMMATFSQGGQQIIPTVAPGEPLNQAFDAVNVNFDQIWAAGPVGSNIQIDQNTILTLNTNGNLVLNPNGIGNVIANAHVIPDQDRVRNLGAPVLRWNTVYAQNFVGNGGGISNITVSNISNGSTNVTTLANANITVTVAGTANVAVFTPNGLLINGTVSSTGNITAPTFIGNLVGNITGNIDAGGANTQVQFNDNDLLAGTPGFTFNKTTNAVGIAGTVTAGNILTGGTISAVGNVSANYYFGNGSQLTGITADNVNADDLIGNILSGNVLYSNLITVGNLVSLSVTGNTITGNLNTAGFISATGNVTANYFFGNGSQLTGIDATSIQNGNSNVKVLANANVTVSVDGTSNIAVFSSDGLKIAGNISATGNISGGNLYFGSGVVSGTGNIYANKIFANIQGNVDAAGNLTEIQFNTTGDQLGATANFTYDSANNVFTVAGGNIVGGNVTTAGTVTATGNVFGSWFIGNVNATIVSATANVVGGNLLTAGEISAGGSLTAANISANNFYTFGLISAAGNITGGNINTTGLASAGNISTTGNVNAGNVLFGSGIVSGTGNIYANKIFANIVGNVDAAGNLSEVQFNTTGDQLGASSNFTYSLANNVLTVAGGNIVSGNVLVGANISAVGNVRGSWFVGNVDAGTVNASANITGGNVLTNGKVSATGTGTFGNVLTGGTISATSTIQGGNVLTPGEVSATGSLTGGNIFTGGTVSAVSTITGGNLVTGGQVTAAGTITGGNVVTAGYVSATGNVSGSSLSTAGNVTGANIIGDNGFFGNVNLTGGITVNSLTSNTFISATGTGTFGNVATAGTVSATGNVSGNYFIGNGAFLTGIDTTLISNGNTNVQTYANGNVSVTVAGVANTVVFTVAGVDVTGNVSASGNVTGGNLLTGGAVSAAGNVSAANVNTTTVWSSSDLNLQPVGNVALGNRYVTGVRYPLADQDAASKIYVDNLVSTSISYHEAVFAATTTTLATATGGTVTYSQPGGAGNGIGATLTTTGSFNLIDSANVQTVGTRILVKNEANATHNGIYVWSNATVITRSTSEDTAGVGNAFALGLNDYFFVSSGNVNLGSAWIVDAPTTAVVFGTSNIEFAQFSQSQVYSANTSAGLTLTGTVFAAKVDNDTTAFDGGGNITVKAGANLVTPNIGVATGTSLSVTGNMTGGNIVTVGYVTATGNVTGGNIVTAGNITATGNITGNYFVGNGSQLSGVTAASMDAGNLTGNTLSSNVVFSSLTTVGTLTSLSVSGNVDGGNIHTAGVVSATGTVTGGNIVTGGSVTATGAVTAGNVNTGGAVSATGTGTFGNIVTSGTISATSTIQGGNILTAGDVSAGGSLTGGNIFTGGQISAVSTITGGNVVTVGFVSATGNLTGGNIISAGQISSTGNITAPTFLGNLEGTTISASGNVTGGNILFGAGIVSGTGNIYADKIFANIVGNVDAAGNLYEVQFNTTGDQLGATANFTYNFDNNVFTVANGNIAGGNLLINNNINANGNITTGGFVSAVGNVTAPRFIGNVDATTLSASGNIVGGNIGAVGLLTAGNISTAGNVNSGNILNSGIVSSVGNVTAPWFIGNVNAATLSASGNVDGGNLLIAGILSSVGNVTAPTFIGNLIGNITGNIDAGGANTEIQFNDNDILAGSAAFTFNKTSNLVTITGNVVAGNVTSQGIVTANLGVYGDIYTTSIDSADSSAIIVTPDMILLSSLDVNQDITVGNIVIPSSGNITVGNVRIANLADPVFNQDAVTKQYVDSAIGNVLPIITNQTIDPDGSSLTYTLDQSTTAVGVLVTINGVTQTPDDSYTVSGNVITFAETLITSDIVQVRFLSGTSTGGGGGTNYANANVVAYAESGWAGNLIPGGNLVYNLGNSTNRWNDLYLSGNTIYLDSATIGANGNDVTFSGNVTGANLIATGNIVLTGSLVGSGASPAPSLSGFSSVSAATLSASGNVTVGGNLSVTGNIIGNVVTRFESFWTVPTGNSTQSFTVSSGTYSMWVDCNIPNGILVWNATGTVTNTNVPVAGVQYAWVYNGGGTPIDFTSIPNQFVGTANTIVRSNVAPSATTNRFDFGINNTSGGNVTVRYGWIQIS